MIIFVRSPPCYPVYFVSIVLTDPIFAWHILCVDSGNVVVNERIIINSDIQLFIGGIQYTLCITPADELVGTYKT